MRVKNLVIHSDDQEHLNRLRYEYQHYVGRAVLLEKGKLTVFTRNAPKVKPRDDDDDYNPPRAKRLKNPKR